MFFHYDIGGRSHFVKQPLWGIYESIMEIFLRDI